jgi:hypothetical protein
VTIFVTRKANAAAMASVLSFESNLCQVEKVTYLKVTQPGYRRIGKEDDA